MRLLLFDIDGTLLSTPGAGRRALDAAFRDVLGWAEATAGVRFGGMTDPLIVREAFARRGLDAAAAAAAVPRLLPAYVAHLARELAAAGPATRVLPGVREALDALAPRPDALVAVLTGNVEAGARLKLRAAALEGDFRRGAFGDEGARRPDLLPVALARARAAAGRDFAPTDVVVIGDTPADVEVARAHGARAVAVATGAATREELAAHAPDVLLDDLARPEDVARALFG